MRVCLAVMLSAVVIVADDHSVIFDEDVDFSTFKTFTVRDTRVTSDRPELNFPAVVQTLGETVRRALTTTGLKEGAADRGDLVVDLRVTAVDYNIGPFGRPNAIRPGRGRGAPVDFTEATIVLDIGRGAPDTLLWRGVYHDSESDARKLAEALSRDTAALLSRYPPKRRK